MTWLIVVAHPDDEALGAAGIASVLKEVGHKVSVCFLSGHVEARKGKPAQEKLEEDWTKACQVVGMEPVAAGKFPNIGMNAVPHLELVRFIEDVMRKTQATNIITSHPVDLNDDHRQVAAATQAAARLGQRGDEVPPLQSLHYMEILSSTDWAFPPGGFEATTYIPLKEEQIDLKVQAVDSYRGVLREVPHSRSEGAIRSQARLRGAQAGVPYAEAFQTVFQRMVV